MINTADILQAKILVVDDDRDTATTLAMTLQHAGYANVTASSDPKAVHDLHRDNNYHLILLDLQMPGMDGFQVMEGLKEFEREGYLPVLAITGEPGHKVDALRLGAKDFLRKPVDIEELLVRVRNMVEVRLLYAELEAASLRTH
ncbi:MAG: response regulator [Pseudomonadota bacterium]|nr:response regulator [Pseudomonadota bacterium]MDQ3229831.1 response regulator [Pseudomonadota bacterium]